MNNVIEIRHYSKKRFDFDSWAIWLWPDRATMERKNHFGILIGDVSSIKEASEVVEKLRSAFRITDSAQPILFNTKA